MKRPLATSAAGAFFALTAAGCAKRAPENGYTDAIKCAGAAEARRILWPEPNPADRKEFDDATNEAIEQETATAKSTAVFHKVPIYRVPSDIAKARDDIVHSQQAGEKPARFQELLVGCHQMMARAD